MITDNKTNFLYLADSLPKMYQKFYSEFEKIIIENDVNFGFLPNTKDVWAVDYMPIQLDKNKFVRFKYYPDYLINNKLEYTISDAGKICEDIGIRCKFSEVILDGGNVITSTNKVILCDKIFKENPQLSKSELEKILIELFEIEKIIFIPWNKTDETGHADGMLRFVNENTVLMNDYSKEPKAFQRKIKQSLKNAGMEIIEMPYNPYQNKKDDYDAKGVYINYLQMKNFIAFPIFNLAEDDEALKITESTFPNYKILPINCIDIAKEGGILNCISWNILK